MKNQNVFKTEELVVDILTAARRRFLLISCDTQNESLFATNGPKMELEEALALSVIQLKSLITDMAKQSSYSRQELLMHYIQVLTKLAFEDDSL